MARLGAALLMAVALAIWVNPTLANASEPVTDCFGGALEQDVLHCQFLQRFHNDGQMTVEAVYRGGEVLFIYLAETEAEMEAVYTAIRARAQISFAGSGRCRLEDRGCEPGVLNDHRNGITLLPPMSGYMNIRLIPGGVAALRTTHAWASFVKLWPAPTDEPSRAPGGSGTTSFDVSDVDVAVPEIACRDYRYNDACGRWRQFPEARIAGWRKISPDRTYVDVMAEPGREAAAIAAATNVLKARFPQSIAEGRYVLNAVPYDYGDLWRAKVVLDRFAFSAANTIGIVQARIADNWISDRLSERVEFPVAGIERILGFGDTGHTRADVRATLHLDTSDVDATLAALPVLLPQLGIAVDVVGVVYEINQAPYQIDRPMSHSSRGSSPAAQPAPVPVPALVPNTEAPPPTVRSASVESSVDTSTAAGLNPLLIAIPAAAAAILAAAVTMLVRRRSGRRVAAGRNG